MPKEKSKSIQALKRSTFPLERWANDERTVSERWTHAGRTLSERRVNDVWTLNASWWTICERWTMSEHGTERKRECNVNGDRTMNARWTSYSESLGHFHCIVLNLNLVGIYMNEFLNFVILFKRIYFLYKRTVWNINYLYMSKRDLYTENKLIIKDILWFYHPALKQKKSFKKNYN